ncbi:inovirus-type Gp2 protein [Marinobacter sp. S0848L]|uniref:YagK/YfjJ domain-containing protein n=1 Tax=Marinobacter sp. S0848L TaxID=2926423 RepID=UPI001FF39B06|nr:inovirus-type Gp2 protein [Marinobacter sp. S0848L]MCK0106958.1 inovirus Gp2 family protein [Marinobacter sp. S0848L]
MKTFHYDQIITIDGLTFPINSMQNSGCCVQMLEACKGQLDAMLSYHNKVFVMYFGLHPQEYSPRNEVMSSFVRSIRKSLTCAPNRKPQNAKSYKVQRLGYAWFREMETVHKHHYHCALMVDGNKVRSTYRIAERVLIPTANRLNATAYIYQKPTMVNRKQLELYKDCLFRISYGTKERGKGRRSPGANDYSTSRIKPNPDSNWTPFKSEGLLKPWGDSRTRSSSNGDRRSGKGSSEYPQSKIHIYPR